MLSSPLRLANESLTRLVKGYSTGEFYSPALSRRLRTLKADVKPLLSHRTTGTFHSLPENTRGCRKSAADERRTLSPY
eukprot:1073651-Prorocentrum_minimum.AAC.2